MYSRFLCKRPDLYWCLNTFESQKSVKGQNQTALKASFPREVDAVISRPLSLKSRLVHTVFARLLWEYPRAAVVGWCLVPTGSLAMSLLLWGVVCRLPTSLACVASPSLPSLSVSPKTSAVTTVSWGACSPVSFQARLGSRGPTHCGGALWPGSSPQLPVHRPHSPLGCLLLTAWRPRL